MTAVDETPIMRSEIAGPGVYAMPDAVYHGDPAPAADGGSLSSTGARKIVPPSTMAHFRYWREHGEPPKDEFDFGHAAHRLVLTEGAEIHVIDAPDYKTKDARAERDAVRTAGQIPVLTKHMDRVQAMAASLREHRLAARLLSSDRGTPEQSLFWRHPRTERWCRARLDLLPRTGLGRRYVIADYKTAADASNDAFGRAAGDHGYHQQDQWYRAGVRALGIDPDPQFLFVVQEKRPPWLVNVIELDLDARLLGGRQNDVAATRFHRCLEAGRWPGYGDDVDIASLPPWLLKREGL